MGDDTNPERERRAFATGPTGATLANNRRMTGPDREHLGAATWAGLLAQWTEFARTTAKLAPTAEGDRWKAAAAPIIALQAVTFALADLGRVREIDERALALDRADLLIRKHAGELHELWHAEEMTPELIALIDDAKLALRAARNAGVLWRAAAPRVVLEHPATIVADLLAAGFDGDLWLGSPGVPLFITSPVAFVRARHGGPPPAEFVGAIGEWLDDQEFEPPHPPHGPGKAAKKAGGVGAAEAVGELRQVYRQFDFALGRAVRDVVIGFDRGLPAGQPLLVEVIARGEAKPVPMAPRRGEMLEGLEVVEAD